MADNGLHEFKYIIKRQTFESICFGTKLKRDPLPISGPGLSSFMARSVLEQFPNLAPNTYDIKGQDFLNKILNKKSSKNGLIGKDKRFRDTNNNVTPPSTKYNLRNFPRKTKKNKIPFLKSSNRFPCMLQTDNPGPGSYNVSNAKKREIPFNHTFGGSATLKPAIPMECVPVNLHVCEMCHLTPQIDFCHKNYKHFMCVQCYSEEFDEHNKYSTKELQQFKLRRECSFMHDHKGTNTFITTLPAKYVKKKFLIETYLSQYFDKFIPQPVHDLPIKLKNVSKPDTIHFKDTFQFYTKFNKYLITKSKRKPKSLLTTIEDDLKADELITPESIKN